MPAVNLLIYLMFFLSGAAALMYEVVWVRSLSLVFGGSHLAVTTVLSIFMGGLAAGSYIIGRYVDRIRRPLRLYGLLELGIALFALAFMGLMKIYPSIYVMLAQGKDAALLYLSVIRVLFAVVALIVPTTLMGGTLPVLTRFVSVHPERLATTLSFLYGFNTLGAVAGTVSAGFVFLRFYSVTTTFLIAVAINVSIGVISMLLDKGTPSATGVRESPESAQESAPVEIAQGALLPDNFPYRLVLAGIGISGFCALGYEILWTRILTMVVGASVYGFTTMLAAFLTGIALGSKAYGILERVWKNRGSEVRRFIISFGTVQIIIGATALLATFFIRDLPSTSIALRRYFSSPALDVFAAHQWSNLALAFIFMVVPAFFMGLAFPLAGRVHAGRKKMIGSVVGDILAYNTVGAILGAAMSGFVMTYFFSIERSLQMLTVVNIGLGVLVIVSMAALKPLRWVAGAATIGVLFFLSVNTEALRIWDTKYFAIFRSNQPVAFDTPEEVREAIENTDVLYYAEGVEAIVSAIKVKGGLQAFITNGRVEASTSIWDQQLQYAIGHLPMLLNKNPKKVLVVGLGSGMTLGATSVHPSVEQVTLVELEPKMLGVARTFGKYNHHVLDNPKLRIIYNDGRNFLLTTKEKFDVITADPIHPWFRGAGYLYTTEYFKLASERLTEGGVMCQWLPIYELTPDDLKSVVKTFTDNFPYTMLWLTYNDAVILGSNSPIMLDEAELERRITVPQVKDDLERVQMGSARDFLSYFALASNGMKAFSEGGIINSDDNLYLEFSAPLSVGKSFLMRQNAENIAKYRESILPYLQPRPADQQRREQIREWALLQEVAPLYDRAHALFLGGEGLSPEFRDILEDLHKRFPWYGPGKLLSNEYLALLAREPRPVKEVSFALDDGSGGTVVKLTAVMSRPGEEVVVVDFVDNRARVVYGELRIVGQKDDEAVILMAGSVMEELSKMYDKEVETARKQGRRLPAADLVLGKTRVIIAHAAGREHSSQ